MAPQPGTCRQVAERVLRRLGPVAGAPLLVPVVAAAAPFAVMAAAHRGIMRLPFLEPPSFPHALVEYGGVVGLRPRRHLDTYGRAQDVFRLTTDADGWRGEASLDQADVVVFGDSFAFGYGVDDVDLYANLDDPPKVKPIASPAYSMVHGVLWMRALAPRLAGKRVVWFVYCGNDLSDNLHPNLASCRMPFVTTSAGRWEMIVDHVSPEPWSLGGKRDNARIYAELCTPSTFSDRAFAAADYLIGEAAQICSGAAASLTVVSISITQRVKDPPSLRAMAAEPAAMRLDLPDERLGQSCAERAVPFIPLGGRLRPHHYWIDDMHWNALGHQLANSVIHEVRALSADRRAGCRAGASPLSRPVLDR